MIKAGVPVFFGCDVGKFSDQATGIMDPALFEYAVNLIFSTIVHVVRMSNNPFLLECLRYRTQIDQSSGTPDVRIDDDPCYGDYWRPYRRDHRPTGSV